MQRNLREVRRLCQRPVARYHARVANPACHHVVVSARMLTTYEETALGVRDALRSLGRPAVVHVVKDFAQVRPLRPGDRVIAYGGHRFAPFQQVPGVLYAGVQAEQYPSDWTREGTAEPIVRKADRFLNCCDLVLEINECLLHEARARGRRVAGVLPFGFSPALEGGLEPLDDPPYDIAFLGRLAEDRRRQAFQRLSRLFRMNPATAAWGRQRFEFLRSARIQLDIHQRAKPGLAAHRFAVSFANRCFLLSEPLPPGSPFAAGRHFAAAPLEEFPDAIAAALRDAPRRREIAAAGHRFFREHYRLDDAVARLLPTLDKAADLKLQGLLPRAAREPPPGVECVAPGPGSERRP